MDKPAPAFPLPTVARVGDLARRSPAISRAVLKAAV